MERFHRRRVETFCYFKLIPNQLCELNWRTISGLQAVSETGGTAGIIYKEKSNFMSNYNYLTQEGYDRLREELEELKTKGRQDAAKAIAEAREKGDLSENAEYDAAKDAQGMLEMRINDLEKKLSNARILDASQVDISKVTVLAKVTIKNVKNGKEITYQLVSESEADLKSKRISVSSPVGKGLLGKKICDLATVETPRGNLEFEIVNITV